MLDNENEKNIFPFSKLFQIGKKNPQNRTVKCMDTKCLF